MKRALIFFLAFSLLFAGLAITPEKALADSWKNGNGKWLPPGILKKIDFDWNMGASYLLPPGLAKRYENSLQKIFEVKNLTRAQVAYILAEINKEEYEDFDDEKEVLRNVSDRASIPKGYQKAVAFVIDEGLMTCGTKNGKLVFEPNKRVTWSEMYRLFIGNIDEEPAEPEKIIYNGYVRLISKIGDKTWIAVDTSEELKTAYFAAGTLPSGLETGIRIKVEVDTETSRIIRSSLKPSENVLENLTFSLKTNPRAPKAGEEVTLIPQLVNSSSQRVSLDDVRYRFIIKRSGHSTQWEFTAANAQDVRIPANNSSDPVALSSPANKWTPPVAGDYELVRAQLRLGNGSWQDVDVDTSRISIISPAEPENVLENLTFSLKTNPRAPKAGEAVTLIPQLVNSSSQRVSLDDVRYRFTIKRSGHSTQWDFTAANAQDVRIPANNSSDPVALSSPANKWTPPAAGDYELVRAQLRLGNGSWQDVDIEQQADTRNHLTANQSSVETNTAGFGTFGMNTFAGATLSRVTSDKWQGEASLKVTTNGENAWQGVNVNYQGTSLKNEITFSFYVKARQGTPLRAVVYDNTNSSYPSGHLLEFTGSGNWERKSITFTPKAASNNLSLQITLNNYEKETSFLVDGLQLEQRSSASAWVLGGSSGKSAIVVAP